MKWNFAIREANVRMVDGPIEIVYNNIASELYISRILFVHQSKRGFLHSNQMFLLKADNCS
jgi:hypothetical protein